MASQANVDVHIRISGDTVRIQVGHNTIAVPASHVDAFIAALQAAKALTGGPSVTVAPPARIATSAGTRVLPRPVSAGTEPVNTTRKRRSRKRVGDALQVWMADNPGWHHEEALLQATIEHEMTDANPKRALKIALGKQRDSVFVGDGNGYWRLAVDKTSGDAPTPDRRPRGVQDRAQTTTISSDASAAVRSGRRRARLKTNRRSSRTGAPLDTSPAVQEPTANPSAEPTKRPASGRWDVGPDALDRAKRNLLGLKGNMGT